MASEIQSPAWADAQADATKGARNGICNRAACDNDRAIHYNRVTMKYYCTPCARRINESPTYGGPLCSWPADDEVDDDGLLLPDTPTTSDAASHAVGVPSIVQALLTAGWKENGHQMTSSCRTTSNGFPGSIIRTGGRQRWIGPGNRRCTIGPRTVCFFDMIKNEPANFRNYAVKRDLDKVLAELCQYDKTQQSHEEA